MQGSCYVGLKWFTYFATPLLFYVPALMTQISAAWGNAGCIGYEFVVKYSDHGGGIAIHELESSDMKIPKHVLAASPSDEENGIGVGVTQEYHHIPPYA